MPREAGPALAARCSARSDVDAGCSIWVTRVVLPEELVGRDDTTVAGGRRSNPRGKRCWPLCPTEAYGHALRRTLVAAAAELGREGARLVRLELRERFGIATFDSAAVASAVCEALEATEVLWTVRGRASAGGGEGLVVLDREGTCWIDHRPGLVPRAEADALLQRLRTRRPGWVRTAAQAGQARQPRQVCYYADSADMTYTYNGRRWAPLPWAAHLLPLKARAASSPALAPAPAPAPPCPHRPSPSPCPSPCHPPPPTLVPPWPEACGSRRAPRRRVDGDSTRVPRTRNPHP